MTTPATGSEPTWRHEIHTDGGRITIVLTGEIDMAGAPALGELLDAAVRGATAVDVDLSGVEFIDSTVINVLVTARNAAVERGSRLTVSNPAKLVRHVLGITGVLAALAGDATEAPT